MKKDSTPSGVTLTRREIEGIMRREFPNLREARAAFATASLDARTRAYSWTHTRNKKDETLSVADTRKALRAFGRESKKSGAQVGKGIKAVGKFVGTITKKKGKKKRGTKKITQPTPPKKQPAIKRGNATVQPTKFRSDKKHIKFREFNEVQKASVMNAALSDLAINGPEYDKKFLKKDEVWGYEIFGRQSYKAYTSFDEMIKDMASGQSGRGGHHLIASYINNPAAYPTQIGALKINRISGHGDSTTKTILQYQLEGFNKRQVRRAAHEKREEPLRQERQKVRTLTRKVKRLEEREEKRTKREQLVERIIEDIGAKRRASRKRTSAEIDAMLDDGMTYDEIMRIKGGR